MMGGRIAAMTDQTTGVNKGVNSDRVHEGYLSTHSGLITPPPHHQPLYHCHCYLPTSLITESTQKTPTLSAPLSLAPSLITCTITGCAERTYQQVMLEGFVLQLTTFSNGSSSDLRELRVAVLISV